MMTCKECKSYVVRESPKIARVICGTCSKQKNRVYEYCYYCFTEWKGSVCPNTNCKGLDPRIAMLANSHKKTLDYGITDVPTLRACTKCGRVHEHYTKCKHMTCPICANKYCQVCLQSPNSKDIWPCLQPFDKCPTGVAPTQFEFKYLFN